MRGIILVAGWSNVLAGLSLTIAFAVILSNDRLNVAGFPPLAPFAAGGKPPFMAWVCMTLAGVFYAVGGLGRAMVMSEAKDMAAVVAQLLVACGGGFVALSADGNPKMIYCARDLGRNVNSCAHLGFTCLMLGTALRLSSAKGLQRSTLVSPYYGSLLFFVGSWIIGVLVFWFPTLANSNSYDELVRLYGPSPGAPAGVHLLAPSVAWTWRWFFAVLGAAALTAGAGILAAVDRVDKFTLPQSEYEELRRASLGSKGEGYGTADPTKKMTAHGRFLWGALQGSMKWKESVKKSENKFKLYEEHQRLLKDAGIASVISQPARLGRGDVLLIVDMQNDFVPAHAAPLGGRFGVAEGEVAADAIIELIKVSADRGVHIIATRDYHPVNHCSFMEQAGPFPTHCVQGGAGSFFYPPIMAALDDVRKKGAKVDIVFKGFHKDVDSFGGSVPYAEHYFGERNLGHAKGAKLSSATETDVLSCSAIDYTGGHSLFCSCLDEDLNAPPDVLSVLSKQTMAEIVDRPETRRLFTTGLAFDFCVLDSSINAVPVFKEVHMVQDAARAAHIPGLGSFGTGFLTDPTNIVEKAQKYQFCFTYSKDIIG